MIIVRDVFQLRFGTAREAVAICKEGLSKAEQSGQAAPMRLMTDLVGNYYTLVMESSHESLAHFETSMQEMTSREDWRAWYQKLLPLLESGHREIFNLVS